MRRRSIAFRQFGHRKGGERARAAATAFRTAGNVGCGGPARILFSPGRGGEAATLEEGVGDHRHQRAAMQASPRTALEVVEAEFLLESLVSLLAHPARLDRGAPSQGSFR